MNLCKIHVVCLLVLQLYLLGLLHFFQVFKLFDILRHTGSSKLLSYALEIGLSIMDLQCPEFLIMHMFELHASNWVLLSGNFYYVSFLLQRSQMSICISILCLACFNKNVFLHTKLSKVIIILIILCTT